MTRILLLFCLITSFVSEAKGLPRFRYAPIVSFNFRDPQESLNISFRIAVRERRSKLARKLLEQGAEVDSQSESGESALMYAARGCQPDFVSLLMDRGADPNLEDRQGQTALMYAAMNSCVRVVRLLVKHPEIDLTPMDVFKKTVIDYAIEGAALEVDGPAYEILEMLEKKPDRG